MATINDHFFKLKDNVHAKIADVSAEIAAALASFNETNNENENKQNSIISEFESITQHIGKFQFDISNCISDISKLYEKTEDLQTTKVDVQGMNEVTQGYNDEFGKITKNLEEVEHKIYLLEEY